MKYRPTFMQQQVIAEQVRIQQMEKEQQIKVQEAEISRHEKELIATVLKQAEIEKQRVSTSLMAKGSASSRSRRPCQCHPRSG